MNMSLEQFEILCDTVKKGSIDDESIYSKAVINTIDNLLNSVKEIESFLTSTNNIDKGG